MTSTSHNNFYRDTMQGLREAIEIQRSGSRHSHTQTETANPGDFAPEGEGYRHSPDIPHNKEGNCQVTKKRRNNKHDRYHKVLHLRRLSDRRPQQKHLYHPVPSDKKDHYALRRLSVRPARSDRRRMDRRLPQRPKTTGKPIFLFFVTRNDQQR